MKAPSPENLASAAVKESEKAGHDIGFEKALLDWIVRFRSSWRTKRRG
jgi:hypothetical protein